MCEGAIKARLKWFAIAKGFGFVVPEDEETDAFLHATTLKRAGVNSLGEGACLLCHIERGPKGAQVTEVLAVLDEGIQPEPIQMAPSSDRRNRLGNVLPQLTGTVKWYEPEKGYGFVAPDDGQSDVFLHKRCLERHGLETIEPRTTVVITVKPTSRGREVVDFEILK